jgi:hypothetical protein
VKNGLKSGDQLVTSGVRNLKDNVKVEIIPWFFPHVETQCFAS